MLVSLREIAKYVDISGLDAETIASRLTFSGIEVEEIKELASATNLVIGEVISCEAHPDSDHLHVCKVDIKDEILQIVCGAPNVRKGLKVIVAKVGAILNHDKEIKAGSIRGIESQGMLCALNELGVDPKSLKKEQIEGIEELNDDAIVGDTEVLKYLGLDDEILDLSLLANRSDCYSLYNVAREIGALFERKVNISTYQEVNAYLENEFKIYSETLNSKSFYAKIVKGIEIKESPKWLKDVLRSQNIKSINNIVDLGNYVMLLTGQPIHCYDYDKLPKKELIIKDDINEEYLALDDKKYNIIQGDLVVTSDNKTMCLGGIIGGFDSEISDTTKNIVIEVASFDFAQIRKTSTRLGLMTDSSTRFIKGINKDQSEDVLNLFIHLLKDLTQYQDISNILKYDTFDHSPKYIECSKEYINKRLGSNFELNEIIQVLTLLHFEIEVKDDSNFVAKVPSFRIDVEGKADLSEEVIRYLGFDSIKEELPVMETTIGKVSLNREKERMIEKLFLNHNINEALTYTLVNEKDSKMFNILNLDEHIVLANPLTEDHKYLRTNILTSLLRAVEYNINHQNNDVNLFEISNVYSKNKEETHLAFVLEGNTYSSSLLNPVKRDFYDAKGLFTSLINLLNIDENRLKFERYNGNELHIGRSALIKIDNKLVGVIGEIHPLIKKEFSFKKEAVIVGEINLSILFNIKSSNNKFMEISKFPSINRDLAFVISKDINYLDIKKEIKKSSSLIKNISIFDIYEGENVKDGYISLALRIVLESMNETLKDENIVLTMNKIKQVLINKFKAEFRE